VGRRLQCDREAIPATLVVADDLTDGGVVLEERCRGRCGDDIDDIESLGQPDDQRQREDDVAEESCLYYESASGGKGRTGKREQGIWSARSPVPPFPRSTHLYSTCNTARKASCGISTLPSCFIRFLPSFCFSRSLRLRLTSPP